MQLQNTGPGTWSFFLSFIHKTLILTRHQDEWSHTIQDWGGSHRVQNRATNNGGGGRQRRKKEQHRTQNNKKEEEERSSKEVIKKKKNIKLNEEEELRIKIHIVYIVSNITRSICVCAYAN